MIFNSLKIKNIFSLKGEHFINFDHLHRYSSLIAITGPTGAGKSTILNSITLALFGKTHLKLNREDYLTLGEKKGAIELSFSILQNQYTIFWSITQNGSLSRKLTLPNAEVITTQLNEHIENIIKLNFEQFTKTVILPQGEFATFITSTFTHRKNLLEQLTNQHELKLLNKTLQQQIKLLEGQKTQLQQNKESATLLPLAELQELESRIANLKQETIEYQQQIDYLSTLYYSLLTLKENIQQIIKNNSGQKDIQYKLAEITTEQNKLKAYHSKLLQILNDSQTEYAQKKPELEEALQLEQQINQLQNTLNYLQENLQDIQKQKTKLQQELTHQQEIKQTQQKTINTIIGQLNYPVDVLKYTYQKHSLQNAMTISREVLLTFQNIQHLSNEKSRINQELDNLETKKIELDKTRQELTRQLTDYKKITTELKSLDQQRSNLEESIIQQNMLQKELPTLQEKIKQNKNEQHLLEQKLLSLTKKLLKLNEKLINEQHALQQEELADAIAIIEMHHQQQNAQHCLVCNNPLPQLSSNKYSKSSKRQTLIELITELQHDKEKLEKEVVTYETQLHELTEQSKELQLRREEITNKISPKLEREYQQLQTKISHFQDQLEIKHKTEVKLAKIEESISNKQAQQQKHQKHLNNIEQTLSDNNTLQQKKLETIEQILDWDYLPQLTNSSQLEAFSTLLNLLLDMVNNEELLQQIQQQHMQITHNQKDIQQKIVNISQELSDAKCQLTKILPTGSAKQELENWQQLITTQQTEEQKVKHQLDELEFTRREQVSKLDILQLQKENIEQDSISLLAQIKEQLQNSATPNTTIFVNYLPKLELLLATPQENGYTALALFIEDELEVPLEKLKIEAQQQRQQLAKFEERVKIHYELQKKQQKIDQQLSKINQQLIPKLELAQLIGDDKFRNYVLSTIEHQLVIQSNFELNSLCQGRYQIQIIEREFFILDGHRNGELRKLASLSGGEKFMVSLAMALALAEMTRGATEINSFFIDEGFGSLDPQSLEEVLEVLQNIQTRGKNITIITHVQEFAKRIPLNLQVLPQHEAGTSTLKIEYN